MPVPKRTSEFLQELKKKRFERGEASRQMRVAQFKLQCRLDAERATRAKNLHEARLRLEREQQEVNDESLKAELARIERELDILHPAGESVPLDRAIHLD